MTVKVRDNEDVLMYLVQQLEDIGYDTEDHLGIQ